MYAARGSPCRITQTLSLANGLIWRKRLILASLSTLAKLLAEIAPSGDAFTVAVTDDWRQGRTIYGGLSAGLCVETAGRAFEGLPPLRAAQFAFVGPAAGDIRIVPQVLRRGKSTVFAAVDLFGEAGLATRALLCFGAARESAIALSDFAAPHVAPPEECAAFIMTGGHRPAFLQHFEIVSAGGSGAEFLLWVRHQDDRGLNSAVSTTALADMPPPAVMAAFGGGSPASTMTWEIDFLHEPPVADDGWRLVRSRAQMAGGGYSSQSLDVWDRFGNPMAAGRQSVAVFA